MRSGCISGSYNTLSVERIRLLAGAPPAPDGVAHRDRHFTVVARFVSKKNLKLAIEAYANYHFRSAGSVPLHLCGSGPLEAELRSQVRDLRLEHKVVFRGFLQTADICQTLAQTLALILPSVEEQFGNVVLEALAMGVPIILSDNCGARDKLVRTAVNGFIVEPDNAVGFAYFMTALAGDESLWRRMAEAARAQEVAIDAAAFARSAVEHLDERIRPQTFETVDPPPATNELGSLP
jgi:glycosyltransferase involved in cell wall biosynthesis